MPLELDRFRGIANLTAAEVVKEERGFCPQRTFAGIHPLLRGILHLFLFFVYLFPPSFSVCTCVCALVCVYLVSYLCFCFCDDDDNRYTRPSVVIPLAGVLPFGSIFMEMYYILTSLMECMMYYNVFSFMLVVYIILIAVLVCTTIMAVYIVLNAEVSHELLHPWRRCARGAGGEGYRSFSRSRTLLGFLFVIGVWGLDRGSELTSGFVRCFSVAGIVVVRWAF